MISILVKPASGNCQLACDYCFYLDEVKRRVLGNFDLMSISVLENMIKKVFSIAKHSVNIAFQGGEPLLAGLDFFENYIELIDKYNVRNLPVNHALQTNGILLDAEYANFFKKHDFLLGVSLDGPKNIHDAYRIYPNKKSSFDQVMKGINFLREADVPFNILTVVTNKLSDNVSEADTFFKKEDFKYHQYIPCIQPQKVNLGQELFLDADHYGKFLCESFDLWYKDFMAGLVSYNRHFDNWLGMLLGIMPEQCGMSGHCNPQLVIESNGNAYPCDFYCSDKYCLGSILNKSLSDLVSSEIAKNFLRESLKIEPQCQQCKWSSICRGGCRRYRDGNSGEIGLNVFCSAYKKFFNYAIDRMLAIVNR